VTLPSWAAASLAELTVPKNYLKVTDIWIGA
jgi:hypothetical protein